MQPSQPVLSLRLLATSDLHAHILPWDYYSDTPSENCGLARTATLIAQARAETANCLLLDNGDFLNGNPLGDYAAEHIATNGGAGHPVIAAMNLLGYDAATLGNHDFSAGISLLMASLERANFPVVSANIHRKPAQPGMPEQPLLTPYLMLDRAFIGTTGQTHALRIGVIGFLPPQTLIWEHRHLKAGYLTSDIIATAQNLVPRMRATGADVVIALSHSGIGTISEGGGGENVSMLLAAMEGIDATIAGHTHLVFPPPDPVQQPHPHPLVMPGFFGSHLGVIDLTLHLNDSGWKVVAHHSETRPIARRIAETGKLQALVASAPKIEAAARSSHDALRQRAQTVIGQTRRPLHSFFALITPTSALELVADAQSAFVRAALADTAYASMPLLAAVAPFKAGGRGGAENYTDVPAGPLTSRHAADLYVHPNSVAALHLKGRDLASWLERAVSLFHQITPGARDACLIDPNFPAFNFDMIYGLTYQIDLTAPPRFDAKGNVINPQAQRIIDLCHLGEPLSPDADVVLTTNSYRSSGGSGFAGTSPDRMIFEGSKPTREVLEQHIGSLGAIAPTPIAAWSFLPMPGTTVLFDSSPRAAQHLQDLPSLHIDPLDMQPSGFQSFRLHL